MKSRGKLSSDECVRVEYTPSLIEILLPCLTVMSLVDDNEML